MAKRWKRAQDAYGEAPDVDAFLAEIEAVCRKHNLSLGHEDEYGSFVVEEFSEQNVKWLNDASDHREKQQEESSH